MDSILLKSADGACASIYTHGAHLSSWIPAGGKEQIFLSKSAELSEGVPIRGGVPVIFPQFAGLGSLPKHGFARTSVWRLARSGQTESGAAQAVFELNENIARLLIWPQVFRAELVVTILADTLQLDFSVANNGDTAFSFTCALHTYLAVEQIEQVEVLGLHGLRYWDSAAGVRDCLDSAPSLTISGEIDRIYADVPAQLEVRQPHQRALISSRGFPDAVIWNPGAEKGAALADLEPGGFARMLCVEAAAIMQPVQLAAGGLWSGSQKIQIVAST